MTVMEAANSMNEWFFSLDVVTVVVVFVLAALFGEIILETLWNILDASLTFLFELPKKMRDLLNPDLWG